MNDQESRSAADSLVKERIRERYKGISEDILDVIPARPKEDFYKSDVHKRVGVYARVSTDDPNQTSSYELQKNHYEDMVNSRDNWDLVDIYADEGISGTSLQHRDQFVRMIKDCTEGKVDLIITKSVSRFARNIIDCIGYVRQLKSADPPIGIFFEAENIFTLDQNSEMALSFIATLAQEESHTKSEIMNASIEMRFKRGIFLTPVLLGYDHDAEGNLIINEDEAKTVRLIFFSYLYGYSTQKIADALTQLERYTKKGNQFWSAGSILQILTNERYCGDILARKTFTPNYLDHKSKKNKFDRNQYQQKNHHEPIISREDFFAVQRLIRNAKYGNKGYFPEMNVITSGFLKGYVSIHPRWGGFDADDYFEASRRIDDPAVEKGLGPIELVVQKGSFDLSGYELVRTQFISMHGQLMITITDKRMKFSSVCVGKLRNVMDIEIFIHPLKKALAVRKAIEGSRNALHWAKNINGEYVAITVSGAAFLPTLFKIFGWNYSSQYKLTGNAYTNNGETVLLFCASDAFVMEAKKAVYPQKWKDGFGDKYYRSQAVSLEYEPEDDDWEIKKPGELYKSTQGDATSREDAANNIKSILGEIGVREDE